MKGCLASHAQYEHTIALSSGKCFSLLYIHVIYLMFCIKKQKKWKRINKHFTMMSY